MAGGGSRLLYINRVGNKLQVVKRYNAWHVQNRYGNASLHVAALPALQIS